MYSVTTRISTYVRKCIHISIRTSFCFTCNEGQVDAYLPTNFQYIIPNSLIILPQVPGTS